MASKSGRAVSSKGRLIAVIGDEVRGIYEFIAFNIKLEWY